MAAGEKRKDFFMMTLELNILDWIQTLHTSAGDFFMIFITNLGNKGFIWVVLAILLLIFPKTRRTGIAVTFALILELILCNGLLKPLVGRTRPFDINTDVALLIHPPADFFLSLRPYRFFLRSRLGPVLCKKPAAFPRADPGRPDRLFASVPLRTFSIRRSGGL